MKNNRSPGPDGIIVEMYNVTKIQRQKSSTKFYNLIGQNTEISNKIKIQILT